MQSEIKLVKAGKKPGNDSQVLFLLSVINKGVGRYLEKQVKAQIDPALSTSHADILLYLRLHGPTTISQLQRFLGVTKSTMTALIAKLEAFEYVCRRIDPEDRRVTWIEPAADLERKLEGAILIGEQTREALLSDFNQRERAQLVALLGRIKTNLALLDGL